MNGVPIEQRLRALLQDIERGAIDGSTGNAAPAQDAIPTVASKSIAPAGDPLSDSASSTAPAAPACPLCETTLYGTHCKLICPNCGYREDCSDLF